MSKCRFASVDASRSNCLRHWKWLRDSGGNPGIIRGPDDDLLSFGWFSANGRNHYSVIVAADVFILLLPESERPTAIAFFKAKGVRVDETLLDAVLPPANRHARRPIQSVRATGASCLAYWRRIKNGGISIKVQRGIEDDAIGFGQLDKKGALSGRVRVLVEDFIRLLPDAERDDAIEFFTRRGAQFDAESARNGIDT